MIKKKHFRKLNIAWHLSIDDLKCETMRNFSFAVRITYLYTVLHILSLSWDS